MRAFGIERSNPDLSLAVRIGGDKRQRAGIRRQRQAAGQIVVLGR